MEYEQIANKLRSPLPMKGIERKILISVVLCLLSGTALSLSNSTWSWLNGAGTLIIIIGIWFTWRDFAAIALNYGEAKRKELVQLISKYERNRPKGIISGAMNVGELDKLKNTDQELEKLKVLMVNRLRLMEATILIFGTFTNGFSSLILDLVAPFR